MVTTRSGYRHGVLVHDTDEALVEATRAFVDRGLASGADVLVHGRTDRVGLMREVLGSHPRLEYGFDEVLYQEPTRTLFAYQRSLAERSEDREFWVTGTVPVGRDAAEQAAWHRYESAVDEALGGHRFVALCTYDTRTSPRSVIAGALATHRTVQVDLTDRDNPDYLEPAAFLEAPLAARPEAPTSPPTAATEIRHLDQLPAARDLLRVEACRLGAVPREVVEQFRLAVNEVVSNGLLHGRPPVRVALWVQGSTLTCLVEDSGPGRVDPLAGFRRPDTASSMGLWAARQLVDDLVISDSPSDGCRVLLTAHGGSRDGGK